MPRHILHSTHSPPSPLHPPKQSLGQFQAEGLEPFCRVPGVHDPLDPEFSILKQRLARRIE
jgi:hypothetical protein